MLTTAIADLVGSTLTPWFARCAAWSPDGAHPVRERSSVMATALDLGAWPAELMQPLYATLDAIVGQVRDSLDEEDDDDFPHETWVAGHDHAASALREVTRAVLLRRPAILELLTECVAPRYPEASPLYP